MTKSFSILADFEIKELLLAEKPMLDPYILEQRGKPSYGLGSCGYDVRLGSKFLVHKPHTSGTLDPLKDNSHLFKDVFEDEIFYLAPHTQVLAETVEWWNMPEDVTSLILGKSSMARIGLLVNATPAEVNWRGRLTLELANLSSLPIALHVGQGIAQALFFRGQRPNRTYDEKEAGGIYQNQRGVTLPQ